MTENGITNLQSRFRGVMLGVAIGDALGAPYEGRDDTEFVTLGELLARQSELIYTDDTVMSLALAESLIENHGFDGRHMLATWARYYNSEPDRGYAEGPPEIFRMVEEGVLWDQAADRLFTDTGFGVGSFGNGGAMRVAPAALVEHPDLSAVALLAGATARLTHSHELGMEGAVMQAVAIASLLTTERGALDRVAFLGTLREHVASDVFHGQLDLMGALPPSASPSLVADRIGHGVLAFGSVPAAIVSFLHAPESFEQAACFAINLGGDTDTIASMTCALSGAYLGESAIPEFWRARLEDASTIAWFADALYGEFLSRRVP